MKELLTEKYCTKCHELKPISEYYIQSSKKGAPMSTCSECEKKKHQDRRDLLCEYKVKDKPGQYYNQVQKDMTFEFMKKLGWRYSERTGIWYKSGIKTKDGHWPKIKPKKVKPLIEKIKRQPKFKFSKITKKLSHTKEYHKEYWAEYYKKHKDEMNAERRRKYNSPRKPKVIIIKPPKKKRVNDYKLSKKRWRDANKQHIKEYRDAHKDYFKQYRKDHREEILANRRRRERGKGNPSD